MGWFTLSAGLDGGLFSFASTMQMEIEPLLNRCHLFPVASENGEACLLVAVSPFLLLQNAKALYRHIAISPYHQIAISPYHHVAISHRPQRHCHIVLPWRSDLNLCDTEAMPSPVYMAIPWRWTIWCCSASVGFADATRSHKRHRCRTRRVKQRMAPVPRPAI
jgi:hypothetical protein